MTEKNTKNLQDSKKSCNFATDLGNRKVFLEICSPEPCSAWKPKEAMSIRDMLVRTDRGQRLDVNARFRAEGIPDNMYMAEYEDVRLPDGSIEKRMKRDNLEDKFEHTPPDDLNDIVDVIRYQENLNARKAELKDKHKKQTVANAPNSVPAGESETKDDKVPGAAEAKEA